MTRTLTHLIGTDGGGTMVFLDVAQASAAIGASAHPDLVTHESLGLAAADHTHGAGAHTHTEADVTSLTSDLSGKAATGHDHAGVYQAAGSYATATHAHAEADVTNLTTDLAGKAASGHNHDAAYSASGHTHSYEAAGAVATHEAASDPHAGYLTSAEGDAAYATAGHTHPGGSEAFPVGSVFISVVATNPATLLGYGTWAAFGAGRVLIGNDGATYGTDEATGGAETKAISAHAGATVGNHTFTPPNAHTDVPTHTHDTDSQGAHVHDEYNNSATTGPNVGWGAQDTSTNTASLTGYDTGSAGAHTHTAAAPSGAVASQPHSGGGVDAHSVGQANAHSDLNVVQPYVVVHMWKRTA